MYCSQKGELLSRELKGQTVKNFVKELFTYVAFSKSTLAAQSKRLQRNVTMPRIFEINFSKQINL